MSRPRPTGPERRARAATRAIASAAILALLPAVVGADWPTHRLDGVFPTGGQAGTTVEVRPVGGELESADRLWFDHPGIVADRVEGDDRPPRFRVTIAPDVPPGLHDVRAAGPLGVSNPRAFAVGRRPEAVEREPNNGPAEAGPIALGSVVNGLVDGATDVDWFAFEGEAGYRVLVVLDASRLDSALDGEVRLLDAGGRELGYGHDVLGRSPVVDATLPADGTYFIEVRDVVYAGSPAHGYRLTLHDGPVVDAVSPRAIAPGATATVSLSGRNLGGEPTGVVLPGGRPLERRAVTIIAPPGLAADPDRPGVGYFGSPGAGIGGFWYTFETDRGAAAPVFLAEAMGPVVVEAEDDAPGGESMPMPLTPPCDVSADFSEPGDADVYRFEATKGQVWIIEVVAERIGSPVDPTLLVQQVRADGSVVRDIAEADDRDDPGTAPRFGTGTVDPAVRFQAPEDGLYQIIVGDLDNPTDPAPGAVYRLVIRPERPDFVLVATPGAPGGPEGVTLRAGGRSAAWVLAHRLDGFAGPIRVEAEALPAGVSAEPVVIGAGRASAPIVFTAPAGVPAKLGTVRLVGHPLRDDGSPADGPPRVALAGSMTRGPSGNQNPVAPARLTRGLVLAVLPDAPFLLSAGPTSVVAAPGEKVELAVRVARRPGVSAEVELAADALPEPFAAGKVKVEAGQDAATFAFDVPGNAPVGTLTFLLRGTAKVTIPDPADPSKPREVTAVEPSNPITLTIRKK